MKRRSWGVLLALALTLLLLTTGALAADHENHALCTHTGSSCKCPESAKSDAFTDAKALTYKSSVQNGNTYYNLCINGVELESNYNGAIEYFILPTGNYYLAEDVTSSYAIRIQSGETVNLCLNGHSITKIADDENVIDGVISVDDGATFTLCNCKDSGKITHGTKTDGTKYTGRGVRCGGNKGTPTFIMYSGEISGNHAGTSSVRQDGAGVEMQGGTFTMYGGKITDNKVQYKYNYGGGGVCLYDDASFTMYDGEISRNTSADDGGGISAVSASFVMQGGTIRDNTAAGYGGGLALYNDTFKLSGGIISGNTAANGGGVYNYDYNGSRFLTISGSTEIKDNKAESGGGVYVNSGNINMTGGLITGNEANKALVVGTVNASGGGVYVNGGTFTMSDTASITDNNARENGTGGGVYVGGGSFTMNGGEISRNTTDNLGSSGGVCLNGGSFFMRSGSITGNSAGNGAGGVDAVAGTFTMTGGSITGNTASYGEGGGIRARIVLNMSGSPVIQGNTVGGSANNVYLTSSQLPITLTGALDDDALIYVTPADTPPVEVASRTDVSEADAKKFHADDTSGEYEFVVNDTNYYIVMRVKPHEHYLCGGESCNGAGGHSCSTTTFDKWTSKTTLPAEGTYYLTDDVTLSAKYTVSGDLTLDLNGHSITMEKEGAVIDVTGSFTLTDCKGGVDTTPYGKITHKTGVKGSGVNMNKANASFTMYGGNIYGNTSIGNGGGIWAGNQTVITMYGGEITGNTASSSGSSFGLGGGVFVNGTFTMHGGSIYDNTATENGGGVCINSGGTFTMNSGSISGNETSSYGGYGGGVYVGGTFTMNSGTIGGETADQGNTAIQGGGVYVGSNSTFRMGGASGAAKIIGNKLNASTVSSGGVHVNGNFEIAGKVSIQNNNNSSMTESSNVYLPGDKTIRITGELVTSQPEIGITLERMPTTGPVTFADGRSYTLTENDAAAFYVDNHFDTGTYTVQLESNHLLLYLGQPHKHKVCVGTDETGCSHPDLSFRELIYDTTNKQLKYNGNVVTSSSGLYAIQSNAGNLYLTDDIRIDGTIQIAADVTLCLNGHSIISTVNKDVIEVAEGKTLTLCDCRGSRTDGKYGQITHQTGRPGRGVTLGDGSTFNMYSGEISGNYVNTGGLCSGVYVPKDATFSVAGNARVTGNNIQNMGSQAIPYSNIYLKEGAVINVIGELGTDALISVTTEAVPREGAPVNIATTATDGWISAGKFKTDDEGALYKVVVSNDGKTAQLAIHDHNWRVEKGSADNILVERCATGLCNATGGTLTLTANDATFDGQPYDDARWSTANWQGTTVPNTTPITYEEKNGETYTSLTEAPTKAGSYRASVTVDNVTATKEFKISRATLNLNARDFSVIVPNNPTYDGDPKTVTKAEFDNDSKAQWFGKITVKYYDYDTGDPVDKPTNAGTYGVRLDVAAGDGYEEQPGITDFDKWKFTIQQADQDLSYATVEVSKTYGDGPFTNDLTETAVYGDVTYASSNPEVATVAADGTVTIVGAGTTTITAKAAGTTNYQEATASYTLNVAKKEITVSGITAKNKYYDKTTGAELVCTSATLTGKVNGDDLSVTATGTFDTADAGKDKTVTIADLMLTGGKAGNYKLAADGQQTTATATIKRMPLKIVSAAGIADKDYDGDADLPHVTVLFEDVNKQSVIVGYSISATFPDADADDVNVDVTVEVTLSSEAEKNYELTNSPFTVKDAAKINKIDPTLPAGLNGWQNNALSTVTLPDGWMWKNEATVMNETGSNKEFSAHYAGDPNHKAGDYTLAVTVSAKKSASLGNFTQPACTYGETLPDATYDAVDGVTKTTVLYEGTTNGGTTYGPSDVKPTEAGNYTVTVTCETIDTIYNGSADFTIAKKPIDLDVTLDCGKGFVYDRTEKIPTITVNFKDTTTPLPAGEYTVSISNNINASVGNRDGVVTITSTGTGNYTFGEGYYHFNIAPKELTMDANVPNRAYDGTTDATVNPGGPFDVIRGDEVLMEQGSVIGTFDDAFVGTGKRVTVPPFTLAGDQAGNYTLKQPTVTGNIIAADQNPTITAEASVPRGGKTLDLSGLVTGVKENGNVHFAISAGGEYATLSGSTLTTKNDVGTVKITVTIDEVDLNGDGKVEYNAYSRTDAITVTVKLKDPSSVTNAPAGIDGLVYDGNDQTLIAAGTADGGELQYKLDGGTYSAALPTAKNAGDYTVWYKVAGDADHEDSQEQSVTVTIGRASATVTALDRRITAGQAAPDLTQPTEGVDYTVSGLIGADTLSGTASMAYYQNGSPATPDTGKSGTYDIVISGLSNSNYDVQFVPGTLTIDPKPAQRLGIDAPERTPGGSFELTPKNAKPGETVTITVTPDEGYELGDLIVRDVGGENIPLTRESDDEFSFVMPKSSVRISVSFVREGDDGWFVDVPGGAYYYDAVKWAVEQGVTNGTDKTHYSPDGFCTRAQIVTFLWRAAGRPEPASMSSFVDVPADAYYAKAVAWAAELGIARGIDATHFDPDGICTRAHAVTFLARAAEAASGSGKTPFTDVSETAYYAPAVKWAAAGGVTAGVSATRFAPDRTCTRAQIVTFLYRFYALA